jgi:hypothetical protein
MEKGASSEALNGYISDGLRDLTQEAILRLHGSQ